MKMTLLCCLAALTGACTSSPSLTPPQAAVSEYLKKTLDDPASYEPVRWGAEEPWRELDADTTASHWYGKTETLFVRFRARALYADYAHVVSYVDSGGYGDMVFSRGNDTAKLRRDERSVSAASKRVHASTRAYRKLLASIDSTKGGIVLWHTFRAKNKLASLVLDSACFVVAGSGGVCEFR